MFISTDSFSASDNQSNKLQCQPVKLLLQIVMAGIAIFYGLRMNLEVWSERETKASLNMFTVLSPIL